MTKNTFAAQNDRNTQVFLHPNDIEFFVRFFSIYRTHTTRATVGNMSSKNDACQEVKETSNDSLPASPSVDGNSEDPTHAQFTVKCINHTMLKPANIVGMNLGSFTGLMHVKINDIDMRYRVAAFGGQIDYIGFSAVLEYLEKHGPVVKATITEEDFPERCSFRDAITHIVRVPLSVSEREP